MPTNQKCSVNWQPTISLVNFVLKRDVHDIINDIPPEIHPKGINKIPEWQDGMMMLAVNCILQYNEK